MEQREKLYAQEKEMLKANMTNPEVTSDSQYDIPFFNALCRGEEYRVSLILNNYRLTRIN